MSLIRTNVAKDNTNESLFKKLVYAFDVLEYNGENLVNT